VRSGTKILVIDDHVPTPDRHAAGLRMLHLLLILHAQGHAVTFIPGDLKKLPGYAEPLQKSGIKTLYEPYLKSVEEYLQKHGAALDIVILSRLKNARKFLEPARKHAPRAKIIFDTVDLYFLRNLREAELLGDAAALAEAELMRAEEMFAMDGSDETWVVSTAEKELLAKEKPNVKVEIVTTVLEIPGCAKPFSARRDLLFIGGFRHKPNVDAMIWFSTGVFPLVLQKLPDVKFHIIGGDAPESVAALASENILVAGHRPDITEDFQNIKLSVAPLRFGAGVKGKINVSMSYGVPVVATTIAAEGMGLTPGEDVLVADDPQHFADAVAALYTSENLWERLSANGLEMTKKHYSVETMRKTLAELIARHP
jgi:glycosyltransferase involved in cell wall biosynthesis